MNDATPLERARREYDRIGLPTEAYERILHRVLERTPALAPRWLAGVAVGFAVGCAAIAGFSALQRQHGTGNISVPNDATVLDIQGIVGERASDTDKLKRVSAEHKIGAGAWIETREAASVRLAIGPHRAQVGGDTRVKLDRISGDHLAFSLARGRLLFNVEPLPKGRTLAVRSGELMVEVVGTVFSVERNAACSAVKVIEGRVRTSFRGKADSVGAGEAKEFCAAPQAPDHAAEPPVAGVTAPGSTSPSIPIPSPQRQLGRAEAGGAPRSLTDEERVFRRGIETLKSGGSLDARASFDEYLRQYPNGAFSQDARFHLIRLVYAQGDMRQTVALGREFLRLSGEAGIRSNEVRLLVAQCLLQQGNSAEEAFTLLTPLAHGASTSHEAHAEQILYLYILAANRSGRQGEARSWAAQYLGQYPTGRYVEEVTRVAVH